MCLYPFQSLKMGPCRLHIHHPIFVQSGDRWTRRDLNLRDNWAILARWSDYWVSNQMYPILDDDTPSRATGAFSRPDTSQWRPFWLKMIGLGDTNVTLSAPMTFVRIQGSYIWIDKSDSQFTKSGSRGSYKIPVNWAPIFLKSSQPLIFPLHTIHQYNTYIFGMCTDVVCRLGVISTLGQPSFYRLTVCGRVVAPAAFKAVWSKEETKAHYKIVIKSWW